MKEEIRRAVAVNAAAQITKKKASSVYPPRSATFVGQAENRDHASIRSGCCRGLSPNRRGLADTHQRRPAARAETPGRDGAAWRAGAGRRAPQTNEIIGFVARYSWVGSDHRPPVPQNYLALVSLYSSVRGRVLKAYSGVCRTRRS